MLVCGLSAPPFIHAVGGGLDRLHDETRNTCALMPICIDIKVSKDKCIFQVLFDEA